MWDKTGLLCMVFVVVAPNVAVEEERLEEKEFRSLLLVLV